MPPPMQSDARPFFASRRSISCSSVTSTRQPDAPIGCPSAIAPPLTLIFARVPAHFLVDRAGLRGERLVDLHQVEVGRLPAGLFQRAARRRHRAHAHDRRIDARRCECLDLRERLEAELRARARRSSRAPRRAPSFRPDALAAVTDCLPCERRAAAPRSHSSVVPVLMNSSLSNATGSPLRCGIITGTISSLNLPAFCAASALFWLATANSSCCAREIVVLLRDVLGRGAHVVLVVDVPQAVDDHACRSAWRRPCESRRASPAARAATRSCFPGRRR